VIPNFNGIPHLPECLSTLSSQSFTDFEVVMVDNASTDESVDWVRTNYPWVRIVQREVNGGPTKSLNYGIRASRAEYVVLINNDVAADKEWLGSLVHALDNHPQYDFGASMMLLYFEDDLLQAAGDVYSVRQLHNVFRGFGRPPSEFMRTERILAASGGAAIYRRSLFDDVGLFDEDLYWVHQDTDLSLRCLLRGKRCLYVPDARIRHKIGLCRDVPQSPKMQRFDIANAATMAAKNLPLPLLAVGLAATAWRDFRRTVPVRPSYWHLIPGLLREQSLRTAARAEGFRIGWSKRHDLWRSRTASRREIYRWLLHGYGPA